MKCFVAMIVSLVSLGLGILAVYIGASAKRNDKKASQIESQRTAFYRALYDGDKKN
jgi:hypothetical protein